MPKQRKLCHIRYPFLIGTGGFEFSSQQVWRNLSYFALIRVIFAHSDLAEQPHLPHYFQYRFLIDLNVLCMKNYCDSAMTDSTFVFFVNRAYSSLYSLIFIQLFRLLEVIVVSCSCHVCNIQEYSELMLLP